MKVKSIISWIILLSISAVVAIGRLYDERLEVLDINLSVLLSVSYIVIIILLSRSIKTVSLSKTKFILLVFFLIIVVYTPVLWIIYGYSDYGLLKYTNFLLIVIPISIIVMECFSYYQVFNLFIIFFFLSCVLALLGLFVLSDAYGSLSILGGGPIIFARWMIFAIILLLFLPKLKDYRLRIIPICLFFILALAAGSRGPIISFIFCIAVFFVLNFRKIFFKLLFFLIIVISALTFSTIGNKVMELGSVNRIFMNISTHGIIKKATGARFDFMNTSFLLMKEHPLGVGCGNWRSQSNIMKKEHLMIHPYPHNLFFEIANEFGVQTLVLFILLLLYVFFLSYNKMTKYLKDRSSLYPVLFYLLMFFSLCSMVSGDLGDARILFIIISMILIPKPLILCPNEK